MVTAVMTAKMTTISASPPTRATKLNLVLVPARTPSVEPLGSWSDGGVGSMDMDGSAWRIACNVRRAALVPALVCALSGAASAQTPSGAVDTTAQAVVGDFKDGARIVDADGSEIAEIQYRLAGADGAVRQVLVRTGGVAGVRSSLKALPVAALTPKDGSFVAPLTRTELLTLPDASAPEPASDPARSAEPSDEAAPPLS